MAGGIEMNQSGQNVQGPETNLAGNAGTVFSGQFQGPVNVNS
ncbi:MAG TPA: hypothetical protein PKL29_09695 [Methanothrix sp.]|nr:hypothetical protein [Methanothrix sp.]